MQLWDIEAQKLWCVCVCRQDKFNAKIAWANGSGSLIFNPYMDGEHQQKQ